MARMSRSAFYKKAMNLVKRHGEVIVYLVTDGGYQRRRKFRSDGKCFVSYFETYSTRSWGRYSLSCFVSEYGKLTVEQCFKHMISHDRGMNIVPMMMQWGKGKNMRRLEYDGR